ncbi:MAG: hypothetical protein JWO12_3058 [Frankiales bacterium]|nr:hypothetical protein [Frankiales bacterium]
MAPLKSKETLQELSRALLADVPAVCHQLVPVLVAVEPPGFYDDEALADLRVAAEHAVRQVLRVLAGDLPEGAVLDVPRTAGRRQVQQNLPLEGVLRGYRLAGGVLWEHLVALAREAGPPTRDALLEGAGDIWRVLDLFSQAASDAYREEESLLRLRDDRVQASVLGALLDGRGADPQFARDSIGALGVGTGPFVCVVGLTEPADHLALENARERLRLGGVASVWVTYAGSEVGLVAVQPAAEKRIRELLEPAVRGRAGMSPVFAEVSELPRARRLADTAARCEGTRAHGLRVLDDDLLAGLVVEAPLVGSMIYERTVGRLLDAAGPDGPALLSTLRAFFEAEASLNIAAANSFVHRNTMLYRLNKIEKLTGLSVRELHDQVVWVLALKEFDNCR